MENKIPAMSSVSGQKSMLNFSAQQIARANETFLHLVQSGMTRNDLERCIKMRPELWKRFEHWLDKLPLTRRDKHRQVA